MNDLKLTDEERELIEAIRNLKNSKHNYSKTLELYVRALFEALIE